MMDSFILRRIEDVSGISGTGVVAEGVEFSNGKCALCWTSKFRSVAIYDSIKELKAIHLHEGKTEIEFTNHIIGE
jgi:hypothetical protein